MDWIDLVGQKTETGFRVKGREGKGKGKAHPRTGREGQEVE